MTYLQARRLRDHDRARDPVLPRGLLAQETVWGRALRTAMWGAQTPNGRLAIARLGALGTAEESEDRSRRKTDLDSLPSWAGQDQGPTSLSETGEIEGGPPEGVGKVPAVQVPAHGLGEEGDIRVFGHARAR